MLLFLIPIRSFWENEKYWEINYKCACKKKKEEENRKVDFIGIDSRCDGSRRFQEGKKPPAPHLSFSHATVGVIGTYCSSYTAGSRIDRESGPRGIPRSWRSSLCPSTPRT